MFSAIAAIFSISWIIQHKVETVIILLVIIFLIYRLATRPRRLAHKAKLAAQERARQLAEDERIRAEKEQKEAEAVEAAKESAIQRAIAASPGSERYRTYESQCEINTVGYDLSEFKIYFGGKYTTLDFETTGLSPNYDQIVEIGACKVENGEIIDQFHQYVDPGIPMPSDASAVNHITDQMLAGQPKIYEVLPALLNFIGDDILVCHNARFDVSFLAQACMRYGFVCPSSCFDSMDLIAVWPDLKSRKLSCFLDAAGIENKNAHSAIGDAEALAYLMIISLQKPFHIVVPADFDFGYSTGHFTGTVDVVDSKLKGKKFVVTGEIEGYEREDFEKMIASHGGKCTLKISTATDYLIVGLFRKLPDDYISSKEEYARKLIDEGGKIQIITPDDVYKMLEDS